ncbi:MAG: bifunctional methylenetetrahydrofolate dehydrogenase/methenyltetrahydrofolate cyclohydrolase FolD [Polyangia bacterium]
MSLVLDGKAIAQTLRAEQKLKVDVLRQRGVTPGLAVVLVGEDPASHVYVRNKTKACEEAGVAVIDHKLAADTTEDALLALVAQLNQDPAVDGILVQLPLPKQISEARVIEAISPDKDVDGFHPENVGRLWTGQPRYVPCTPLGVIRLLERAEVKLEGADAVVLGRSNIVGRPMAALLLGKSATVSILHSKTRDLAERVSRADVVIAAIGKAEFVRGAWIKEGAAVIDVGINRLTQGPRAGKLCGDVEFAPAAERASVITPVPGGVGPMTIACLVENTVTSASRR